MYVFTLSFTVNQSIIIARQNNMNQKIPIPFQFRSVFYASMMIAFDW